MKNHLPNTVIISALTHGDKGIHNARGLAYHVSLYIGAELGEHEAVEILSDGVSGKRMYYIAHALGLKDYMPGGFMPAKGRPKVKPIVSPEADLQVDIMTSEYIGVTWHKTTSKWRANATHNGKCIELGHFDNLDEACRAYFQAAMLLNSTKTTKSPTSHYRGVTWDAEGKKWRARMNVKGKVKELGSYQTPELAALAVNDASIKIGRKINYIEGVR